MGRMIGVLAAHQIATGLVEHGRVVGSVRLYPESGSSAYFLDGMPAESISQCIFDQIEPFLQKESIDAIGVGIPGIIRGGIIQESPNLPQTKGFKLEESLTVALKDRNLTAPLRIFNDADVIAAGIAATRDQLDKLVRTWHLGHGVGYGRYPWTAGVWEGGHTVVSLDPKERFCGCGGRGHLEGIVGGRAMRLRFLDMEPEEIFANARAGDPRCAEFVKLWHRALAAATATSIAMEGPGKFFITGSNARFVEVGRLDIYLHEMVRMSALQGSQFEVIATDLETGIIGAAVNAEIAARGNLTPHGQ